MYAVDIRKHQWSFDVETITPERAEKILATCNRDNRKIRASTVDRYARMMIAGDWRLSPEAIVISNTNRLLNGQHRLSAVVKSGISVRFLTIRGPDDDVFSVLDRGAPRTTADALAADKREIEVAKLLATLAMPDTRTKVTDFEVARTLPLISDAHRNLIRACNTTTAVFSSAPFRLAAVARIIQGEDTDYVLSMYRNLILTNIDDLPPIGMAAIKAKMQNRIAVGGGIAQIENLGMAWSVFDYKKQHLGRLVNPKTREYIREILEAAQYDRA